MQACFLVFEPANHAFKVIEAAAARGMHVIAFHSQPLSAAGAYCAGLAAIAERHAVASWTDEGAIVETILAAVQGRQVGGTYAAFESLLLIDAALRERLGLPTSGAALLGELLDKRLVRQRLRAAGLSRLEQADPRAVAASGAWPFPGQAGYLKPVTGSGSVHVSRCTTVQQVAAGLADWDNQSIAFLDIQKHHLMRTGALFLEQAAEGELMSLEGFVVGGQYHALGLTSRTVLRRDPSIEMGATFPYEHPQREAIEAKVRAVHAALGLQHGATHTELIVGADGGIEIVELNVRFAGSDVLLLINMTLAQSIGDLLTDLACGLAPRMQTLRRLGYASMQQLLAPSGTAVLRSVDIDPDQVVESRLLKPLDSDLPSADFQHSHVAGFIVTAPTYEGVLEKVRAVRASAAVNGEALGENMNNQVVLR